MEYLHTITKPDGRAIEMYVYCAHDDHYYKGVTDNGTTLVGDTIDEVLAQWHGLEELMTIRLKGHSLVIHERPDGGYVGQWNKLFYHGNSLTSLTTFWRRDIEELL